MFDFLWLIIGGFFEPVWVFFLEKADHAEKTFSKYLYYAVCLIAMLCSLYFLSLGMRGVGVGIAYAVWTAVGAIVTIVLSRLLLDEKFNYGKIVAITMILIGITGLQLAGGIQ